MSEPSAYRFRTWLLEQLRIRQWTRSDLADRAGLNRSAVTKWLAPVDSSLYRHPAYESCVSLARVLALPLDTVLEEAGLKPMPSEATPLQRRVIALIPHIPDPLLEVLYHQLVPMVDDQVQQKVLTALRISSAGPGAARHAPPPPGPPPPASATNGSDDL